MPTWSATGCLNYLSREGLASGKLSGGRWEPVVPAANGNMGEVGGLSPCSSASQNATGVLWGFALKITPLAFGPPHPLLKQEETPASYC